jgi:flagellar hook-associated protein 2
VAGLRLGGLASGMDTEAVISQLMALEAQPKNRLITAQKLAEGRKTALEDVARQLRTLTTAINDLRSVSTWGDVQKLTSTDDTKVGARAVGSAPAGNVTVEVTQLARSEQRFYTWGAPDPAFAIDGVAVDLSTATNATEAAAKINGTSGITVYAGVVNNQLVLTGKTLGQAIAVTGQGAMTQTDLVAAQKTRYKVNGVFQDDTTASVVQPGGLPGVELTLKGVTASPVTIAIGAPGPDTQKVQDKVKGFVDAYNSTVDLIRGKLTETKVKNPTVTSDYVKGALRGDLALGSMLGQLRQIVGGSTADTTPAVIDTLAEIGVAVPKSSGTSEPTADALAGKLSFDTEKFASALASNPNAIENLLGGNGVSGVSQALDAIVEPINAAASGYIARNQTSASNEAKLMIDRQTAFDRRLAIREERMRQMFSAMESAINASQTQTSWLQGQLSGLPSWSSD